MTVISGVSAISEFDPKFTIINESADYYGRPGDTATFIVEAEGANLSYNWLCRASGASNFEYLTGETSSTLRVDMTSASNGAEYRCFITGANGDMGSTRIATVKLDTQDWQMEYNTSGLRTRRISDDKTYSYIYAGDKLMRMTVGDDILDFSYDANGAPLTMTCNGTVYYYITNLQGDVMSLERADGGSGASYAYDAWGNILAMSGTLAELNPLRYRGYVYDQETGFYYLNSRYYDPAVGRFINADNYPSTGQGLSGNNMFAYCGNNPVSREDDGGEFWNFVIGAAVGGLVGGVVSAVTSYAQTGEIDWGAVAINAAVGAAGGLIAASGLGTVCQAGLTAVISGGGNFAEQVYSKGIKNVNKADVICSTLIGGGTSLLGSAAGKLLGGKIEKAGSSLLNKGKDKLLSGMVRQTVGQSHSKLLRQGANFVAQGIKQINTYRGLSSSVGSLIGAVTSSAYNSFKFSILRW